MKIRPRDLLLPSLLLLFARNQVLMAAEFQKLAAVQRAAVELVRSRLPSSADAVAVDAEEMDNRLQILACAEPLQATVAGDGQLRERSLVAVKCARPSAWSLYVGVRIRSQPLVLRALRALGKGEQPSAQDFEQVRIQVNGLSSLYIGDPAQLAERRLRRPVASGELLLADALQPALLVHRGQQITLLAKGGGIEVRAAAIALSDGEVAQRIRVQNQSTQRIVEAIVRTASLVEVPL
jgi:flagella basal body P-ring formation protein FlgA